MYKFHLAVNEDLATLNALALRSKAHWGYPTAWLEHWRGDMEIHPSDLESWTIVVMQNASQIVGFSAVEEQATCYELHHLWLKPEAIGQGLGRQLLAYTLSHYCINPLPVRVVADPNAEGFYQRFGFETVGQLESWPAGRFLPIMEKGN